jgi:hypothetical protein
MMTIKLSHLSNLPRFGNSNNQNLEIRDRSRDALVQERLYGLRVRSSHASAQAVGWVEAKGTQHSRERQAPYKHLTC